jgi:hypothetical protein
VFLDLASLRRTHLIESTNRDKDYIVFVGYNKALVIMFHPSLAPQCRYNHCSAASSAQPRETNSRNTAREGIKLATICNNISYIQLVYKEGEGTNCFIYSVVSFSRNDICFNMSPLLSTIMQWHSQDVQETLYS